MFWVYVEDIDVLCEFMFDYIVEFDGFLWFQMMVIFGIEYDDLVLLICELDDED